MRSERYLDPLVPVVLVNLLIRSPETGLREASQGNGHLSGLSRRIPEHGRPTLGAKVVGDGIATVATAFKAS